VSKFSIFLIGYLIFVCGVAFALGGDPRDADRAPPKGLGSRHWAAAEISRATSAIAIVVSQSSGTVRLFQNGEVRLRIEPFRRPMKWIEFDQEPASE